MSEVETKPAGELVQVDPRDQTPVTLLSQALAQGVDTQTLQQFMDLQERYEANEARKAFSKDMARCQEKMPVIIADAPNAQTGSLYAKLGKINALIAPVYTKHGFSIMFDEIEPESKADQFADMLERAVLGGMNLESIQALERILERAEQKEAKRGIKLRAKVIHKQGHIEEFYYDVPLDIGGLRGNENKTPIQAKGSSTSYARRYLTCMIFNLAVSDDLDGQDPVANGRVGDEQALKLDALVQEYGLKADALLREFGVISWEQLPASKFEKAHQRIKQIGEQRSKRA